MTAISPLGTKWHGTNYQLSEIDLDNETTSIPSNQASTLKKVYRVAFFVLTLGVGPLMYSIAKGLFNTLRVTYYSLRDKGEVEPKDKEKGESLFGKVSETLSNTENDMKIESSSEEESFEDELVDLPDSKEQNLGVAQIFTPTYHQLKKMEQLSPSAITTFKSILPEKTLKKCIISEKGIPDAAMITKAITEGKFIIVPVVLKGGLFTRGIYSRDHITTLIIDPKEKEIIFNDSKGKTLLDHKSHKVICNPFNGCSGAISVKEMWQNLITQLKDVSNPPNKAMSSGKKWTVIQNTKKYQHDGYNCGVHFFKNAHGYALERKMPSPLNGLTDIRKFRASLMDKIIEKVSFQEDAIQSTGEIDVEIE